MASVIPNNVLIYHRRDISRPYRYIMGKHKVCPYSVVFL